MQIDNHVHMGWYSDGYHSPIEVWNSLAKAGISKAAVSSTSTCAELYHNILTEFYQLITLAGKDNIFPILWITPKMITNHWSLKKLLKSKINWKGIKLHYVAHPDFGKNYKLVQQTLKIARLLGRIPVLFHTGEWENCHADVFIPVIEENQDMKFILAHGRPINETIKTMKIYPNVWTDTAFMPIEHINKLKKEGLSNRVLFGSDAPINRIYINQLSTIEYLKLRIQEIKNIDPQILLNTIY